MKFVRILLVLTSIVLLLGVAYAINQARNRPAQNPTNSLTYSPKTPNTESWLDISVFKGLFGPRFSNSISQIETNWRPGYTTVLFEATRMMKDRSNGEQAISLLDKMIRVDTKNGNFNRWFTHIFSQQAETPPWYADFKAFIYAKKDEDFAIYFSGNPETEIRLDEVVWGGVVRDGIPPLKNPTMISADDAIYLDDSHVAYGISINGDHRAYPKRILAWHEMFKDTIGGQSVCGVY